MDKVGITLLKIDNVEVVDQHIREDGTKYAGWVHDAKATLYS